MTPGSVLLDRQFKLSDGSTAPKYIVVLNDGKAGFYVTVRSTSKDKGKGRVAGCQSRDRFRNYFLPKGSCCFAKESWLMLNEFHEFDKNQLIAAKMSGRLEYINCLPDSLIKSLLVCAKESNDIMARHEQALDDVLTELALQ